MADDTFGPWRPLCPCQYSQIIMALVCQQHIDFSCASRGTFSLITAMAQLLEDG